MSFIYLASPYGHPDWQERQARYHKVCRIAGELMQAGHTVFSPIAHGHSIAMQLGNDVMDYAFWLRQDFAVLPHCEELWFAQIDGFRESKGMSAEAIAAHALGKKLRVWNESIKAGIRCWEPGQHAFDNARSDPVAWRVLCEYCAEWGVADEKGEPKG